MQIRSFELTITDILIRKYETFLDKLKLHTIDMLSSIQMKQVWPDLESFMEKASTA